eukprot:45563-Pelagomonas_calceolata.AAC.1
MCPPWASTRSGAGLSGADGEGASVLTAWIDDRWRSRRDACWGWEGCKACVDGGPSGCGCGGCPDPGPFPFSVNNFDTSAKAFEADCSIPGKPILDTAPCSIRKWFSKPCKFQKHLCLKVEQHIQIEIGMSMPMHVGAAHNLLIRHQHLLAQGRSNILQANYC